MENGAGVTPRRPRILYRFFLKITLNRARWKRLTVQSEGTVSFPALAFGDFFAIDADIDGRLDADADLGTVDRHDRHFHVFAYSQRFTGTSGKN
jgi:hypothetical protein